MAKRTTISGMIADGIPRHRAWRDQTEKEGKTMEAKHTPGPWKREGRMIVVGSAEKSQMGYQSGEYIAQVYTPLGGFEVERANGRLIKAAPDLLAALEKTSDFLIRVMDLVVTYPEEEAVLQEEYQATIETASDAMFKAKGQ